MTGAIPKPNTKRCRCGAACGVKSAPSAQCPNPPAPARVLARGAMRTCLGRHAGIAFSQLASHVFEECVGLILKSDGTVDKFIGDCIMAFWGAPVSVGNPSRNAVQAIRSCYAQLREMQLQGELDGMGTLGPIRFRSGIHFGPALVGNFGATTRWDYTVIGDTVNTAARLEPLNKQFGTSCLVSEAVYNGLQVNHDFAEFLRPMGSVQLLGKQKAVKVRCLCCDVPRVYRGAGEVWMTGAAREPLRRPPSAGQLATLRSPMRADPSLGRSGPPSADRALRPHRRVLSCGSRGMGHRLRSGSLTGGPIPGASGESLRGNGTPGRTGGGRGAHPAQPQHTNHWAPRTRKRHQQEHRPTAADRKQRPDAICGGKNG